MTACLSLLLMLFGLIAMGTASLVQADGELLGFAVVSEVPKDKARVSAKVSVNDIVSDMKLLASETILNNLIWKKLEICHAMKLEGYKVAEGFQVVTVHVIDDPETFTRPWSGELPFKALNDLIFEYACHEGNYALSNVLSGERAQEREAAKKKSQ